MNVTKAMTRKNIDRSMNMNRASTKGSSGFLLIHEAVQSTQDGQDEIIEFLLYARSQACIECRW